ncbi:isoamylase early set domain-containing protein, partial [Pseudoalteromonas carrageenovora]|uniref:isoamylase early set domain-containing protein n=1 Tax=Pseudoalteromonas carrageenovora TaxID=227 RepID=UPI00311D9CF4
KDEAEVTFEISHPEAEQVSLLGEFTDCQPVPMKLNKKQGVFKIKQRLAIVKQFHFRYLIHGDIWDNDHEADGYMANNS